MVRTIGRESSRLGIRAAGLAGLIGLAGVGGCGYGGLAPTVEETRFIETDYLDSMGLDVQSRNGAVTVRRADGDTVRITARLKARSKERLDATRLIAEHDAAGTLVIRVAWADGRPLSNEGCSFEIETPGAYGVRLDSGNGALSIAGLEGEARLDTSNGAITVTDHVGPVFADTSNGRVTLRNVAGPVEVDTSNGSVTVELAEHTEGPVRIDTSNGGVRLAVSPAFRGELVLDTSNGGISFDTPMNVKRMSARRNHAVLRFGEGGPTSVVSTSNGRITVETIGGE